MYARMCARSTVPSRKFTKVSQSSTYLLTHAAPTHHYAPPHPHNTLSRRPPAEGITPRDNEALRRIGSILRYFGHKGFLSSKGWVPHTPMVQSDSAGVFASAWPVGDETVWTVVNRGPKNSTGLQIAVAAADTRNYYDCYHGTPLTVSTRTGVPRSANDGASGAAGAAGAADAGVSFGIDAADYGCVFATPNKTASAELAAFLSKMKAMAQHSLASYSDVWTPLLQHIVYVNQTTPAPSEAPAGMVQIPAVTDYQFTVSGAEIEGSTVPGVSNHAPSPHRRRAASLAFQHAPIARGHARACACVCGCVDVFDVAQQYFCMILQHTHTPAQMYPPPSLPFHLSVGRTRKGRRAISVGVCAREKAQQAALDPHVLHRQDAGHKRCVHAIPADLTLHPNRHKQLVEKLDAPAASTRTQQRWWAR